MPTNSLKRYNFLFFSSCISFDLHGFIIQNEWNIPQLNVLNAQPEMMLFFLGVYTSTIHTLTIAKHFQE